MKQNILGNKMELIRIEYKEQINKTVSLVISKVGGLIKKPRCCVISPPLAINKVPQAS